MNDEITTMSQADAAQLHKLANRMSELGLIDLNDDPDEEIGIGWINDLMTGEIVVAIDTGAAMYWEAGRQLLVQQERPDGLWYAEVDAKGQAGKWRKAGPPPASRTAGN